MMSLFFGSDVYAAAITLSVFMGGLSLGSWLAARWGDRLLQPLRLYGVCEIIIGLYALAFPLLLGLFETSYQDVYRDFFETSPERYHGFRFIFAFIILLVPTVFMGATLPIIVRQFAYKIHMLGLRVGQFYSINTMGAIGGTLAAGFVLLPNFGVSNTVTLAVAINLAIGIAAILMSAGLALEKASHDNGQLLRDTETSRTQRVVLSVMALSGFAALALEVVWMRILIQSFSATVYAFTIMLACFLVGIFYGSHKASKIVDGHDHPLRLLLTLEVWLAGSVAILAVVAFIIPGFFGNLIWGLTAITGGKFGTASIIAQFGVSIPLIIVPTLLLGATFPVAVKAFTYEVERRAHGTGAVYSANTAGGVFGALAGGFILLPTFGTIGSLIIIASLFAVAGILILFFRRDIGAITIRTPKVAVALVLAFVASLAALSLPSQTVVNFNLQQSTTPDIIFHGEGVTQTVDIVRSKRNHTIMMINGNIEADTTYIQRRHFILKGHLPLLLHPDPKDVAVVGLGLGITLGASERHPTVDNIRLVELSPEMVRAHAYIRDVTGNLLDSRKINLRIDDGRNFMAMSDESFDMITADPIHPRITGVGYLYTREYYEDIKKRLRPGGVVTQWMPMYRISRKSFDIAFRTFASVFPNASFWYVRGHGLFVATVDDFRVDFKMVQERFSDPAVRKDLASIDIQSPENMFGHLLMDAEHINKYLSRNNETAINTDDNAYLEYFTPFEFIERTNSIVTELLPFAGWDMDKLLFNAPRSSLAEIKKSFKNRLDRILPELSEPID